jgi:hypothetical protein
LDEGSIFHIFSLKNEGFTLGLVLEQGPVLFVFSLKNQGFTLGG